VGHLDAGEHADQLLGAAGRVAGGDGDGLDAGLAAGGDGGLHGGDGFGLVVLDADQHLFGVEHVAHGDDALEHVAGALAHQQVVAGDEGLAFGAVDHQGLEVAFLAGLELGVAGEDRAAEADHAGVAQEVAQLVGRGAAVVELVELGPAVFAVGLDDHRQGGEAGGVGHECRRHVADDAGGGGMHRRRQAAVGAADALALEHPVARLDQRARVPADGLVQRDDQAVGQRHRGDRRGGRGALLVCGLTPPWNLKSLRSMSGGRLDFDDRVTPFPGVDGFGDGLHADAVDRAGGEAEFAAGAVGGDDGVHLLGGADDGIDRAGLDAQGAADAGCSSMMATDLGFSTPCSSDRA
jgi:hypothetical protein